MVLDYKSKNISGFEASVGVQSKKRANWLGYQDLNLGMPGSKPGALPLGDIPTLNLDEF